MTTTTYIPPADPELFRATTAQLRDAAAGRGKSAALAKQELDRRAQNRAAKKAGARS